MLRYASEVQFADPDAERARRVEMYRRQVEVEVPRNAACCGGPYARSVFCEALKGSHPDGFPTIQAAATFIGTTRSYLRTAMRRGTLCKGYRFVYLSDQRVRIGTGRERAIYCVSEDREFASLAKAAEHGGVSSSTLCGALREANGAPARCGGRLWQYGHRPVRQSAQLYLFADLIFRRIRRPRYLRPRRTPSIVQLMLFCEEPCPS